jgi:hypothetical protein
VTSSRQMPTAGVAWTRRRVRADAGKGSHIAPDKPDWTKRDWQAINRAHDGIVAALKDQDGTHWKEAASERHASYLEVPIWILLHEDGSIDQAHAAIWAILAPHGEALDLVSCTIAYLILTDSKAVQVDFLDGWAEIHAAPEIHAFGRKQMVGLRPANTMFDSQTSERIDM